MQLFVEDSQFDRNELLRRLRNKRKQMDSAIDLLQNVYERMGPISPNDLQELEATIIDNFWYDVPELAGVAAEEAVEEARQKSMPIVSFRIDEDPLTLQNLTTILSVLTELSTKYWLISLGRFADLMEYTQTYAPRFVEEAHVVIAKITHNSPANFDMKFDASATNVADAIVSTIDGVMQAKARQAKVILENQARALEIRQAEQKYEHESQMAMLERDQKKIEVETRRLELFDKQLDFQKKNFESGLQLAGKYVDELRPGIDVDTRGMAIQSILPKMLQLQNVVGLEILLPPSNEKQSK